MSTQDNKPQDGTNPDEDLELDLDLDGTEDADALKAKLQEANKKLGNFKNVVARAKTAEARVKELEADPRLKSEKDPEPKPKDKNEGGNGKIDEAVAEEMTDLRFEGYSKDEVKFIMANGGRKQLEDPNSIVSLAIKAKRDQAKAEDGAGQANGEGGSELVAGKYTLEQLGKMSSAELAKILPHSQQ